MDREEVHFETNVGVLLNEETIVVEYHMCLGCQDLAIKIVPQHPVAMLRGICIIDDR